MVSDLILQTLLRDAGQAPRGPELALPGRSGGLRLAIAVLLADPVAGERLLVDLDGSRVECDMLHGGGPVDWAQGDALLVASGDEPALCAIVLGRIGRYAAARPPAELTLEATESLTLKCGESSVELRADGRAMLKGEDVLLRAKGTQRIRAGNVAIN